MKTGSVRSRNLVFCSGILCLFALACSLGSRPLSSLSGQKQATEPANRLANGKVDFVGTYACVEDHGQTFTRSLGLPTEPSLVVSLADDDLYFPFNISWVNNDAGGIYVYHFTYNYKAHTLVPVITYSNGNISNVAHADQYYSAHPESSITGSFDTDQWTSGKWTEIRTTENGQTGEKGSVNYLWEFVGLADVADGYPRIRLCSWYQPHDFAVVKAGGSEKFEEYCKDWNLFSCSLE